MGSPRRAPPFPKIIVVYSKRGSNPHAAFGARDFKSLVSTYSTIRASFSPAKLIKRG